MRCIAFSPLSLRLFLTAFAGFAVSSFNLSVSAQMLFPDIADDLTQQRGAQIRQQGVQLAGEELVSAFSGFVHYGTYILNTQNRVEGRYSEYHYPDGTMDYADDEGVVSSGQWSVNGAKLCYQYDEDGSHMSGGCFYIYQLDSCYYFFNSWSFYDGYSVAFPIGAEPGALKAQQLNLCMPLIG